MDTIKRVYDLLNEKNMSMYQLTRKTGISYSTVKTAERRGGQLSVDTIFRLCEGMSISLSEFFETEGPFFPPEKAG